MPKKRVKLRSKRLDELDEVKLMFAIFLLGRDLVENPDSSPLGVVRDDEHSPVEGAE